MIVIESIGKNSKTRTTSRDRGALRVAHGVQGDDVDVAQLVVFFLYSVVSEFFVSIDQ